MIKRLPLISCLLFFGYTVISWVLFFRDQRAIAVIGSRFYPALGPWLENTRSLLLSWKLNTVPTFLFALFIVCSFAIYFRSLKEKISARKVVLFGILFQIIVFFSYPVLSTDVLSYILSDRVSVVYHQNVWTTRPDQFKNDPYFGLADWTDQTRIYGGANQFFYSLATKFSGDDLLANLVSHKLVVLIFVLASMAASYKILAKFFPQSLSAGLMAVFWNPLFVLETVGSGHNDILMIFFVILSVWAMLSKKPILLGIFLGLATQVKSTPLLFAVFLLAHFLGGKNFKDMTKFALSYGIILLSVYVLMGVSPLYSISRTAGSINVYWQSLPMEINQFIPAAKSLLTLGLLAFLSFQGLRTVFLRKNPLEIYGQTLLVYLLFFLAAFWNWYPIWILVLLPFLPQSKLRTPVLAYTLTSLLAYVVLWISLRLNYRFFLWPVIMYFTILAGPLGAAVYERFIKKV